MDENEFNFDNDEILRRILKQNNRLLKEIINNTETKDVGDRVIVLDYSSVTHMNGEELCPEDYDNIIRMNDEYYIVIETNKKVLFKKYMQDIVIVNPKTNEQFRTTSKHLRIYRRF
jgi:hypothetical protein